MTKKNLGERKRKKEGKSQMKKVKKYVLIEKAVKVRKKKRTKSADELNSLGLRRHGEKEIIRDHKKGILPD